MSSLFLADAELADLTGYRLKRYQIRWLRANAYPFDLDKSGRPKVLRATMVARLGGTVQTERPPRVRAG